MLRSSSSLLLCFAVACSSSDEPVLTPEAALIEVLSALDHATTATGPEALEAWARAEATFERSLEPVLREHQDPVEVARTEYAFSRVREAIGRGDATAEVDTLASRLDRGIRGPRAVASR